MNKKLKYFYLFIIILFISNCSFDNKTGIWSGGEDEKRRIIQLEEDQKNLQIIRVFSSSDVYLKEIFPKKNVKLSPPKKNVTWKMPNLNLQNNVGNIFLPKIENKLFKKKIGKNKFPISKVSSSPLIYKDNIIFSDDTGSIFSIYKNGKVKWKKNIYNKVYKKIYKNLSFFIYKNNIYIADNVGFIYSISLANGNVNWVKNHGVPIKSSIKVYDDKIFLVNQDNRLLCISINKGSLIWDLRSISAFIKSQNFLALAISKIGDIFMLNSSGDLYKINSQSGSVYWTTNVTSSMVSSNDLFKSSEIVIENNNIYFSTKSSFFSFNANNGYLNWKTDFNSSNTPIIDGKYIFSISDNGYFVNVDKENGKILWSVNIFNILKKRKQNTLITGFVLGSGKIYATTLNGYLIICSATTGKVESFKKIDNKGITSSPVINNGSLYILTKKSKLIGLN
ncbi:PQQ-binding-like beta-propeller repeat protein [bacterium]|nr:PQQ-binding-like beta-propeller repeat protein [bacterium]